MIKELTIYTDGSCYPNPGPAGMAFVCPELDMAHNASIDHATNNQAELMAIRFAFQCVLEYAYKEQETWEYHVVVYSDSAYALRELRRRSPRRGAANAELIASVRNLARMFNKVTYVHVRGHSGNPFNEHCDEGARQARLEGVAEKEAKSAASTEKSL